MPRTRLFKSGNSQAVRIPAELAYTETDIDLEIRRLGDVIAIFPARNNLKDVVAVLRRMPKPARVEKRQPIEVPVRRAIEDMVPLWPTSSTPLSPFMLATAPTQFLSCDEG